MLGVDSKTFDSLKRDLSGSECEESGSRAARDLVPLNCGKPVDRKRHLFIIPLESELEAVSKVTIYHYPH